MAEVKKNSRVWTLFAGILALLALVVMFSPVQAQAISIDNFSTGGQSIQIDADDTTMSVYDHAAASAALGGWRKLRAEKIAGSPDRLLNATVAAVSGEFNVVSGTGVNWRVTVIWDGDDQAWDGDVNNISHDVISQDLVNIAGVQVADGILLSIVDWDGNNIDVTFTVYSGAGNSSTATYEIRGNAFIEPYDIALCFFEGCFDEADDVGTGANFEAVTAIVMTIDSVQPGADLTLDLTFADPARDFGDLPESYTTTISDTAAPLDVNEEGARHSRGNIYLGSCVTRELNGQPDDDAELDGCDDGVTPVGTNLDGQWTNGANGGTVFVTWTSPDTVSQSGLGNGSACLDGWINWDHRDSSPANHTFETSANFTPEQKHVVRGLKLETTSFLGLQRNVTFNVPTGYFPGGAGSATDLAARWRIYPVDSDGNCPTGGLGLAGYKGYIINGEVEDYIWGFTPTAVTLQSFSPAASNTPVIALVGFLSLAIVAFGVVIVRRERRS